MNIVERVMAMILTQLSPEIKRAVIDFVLIMEQKAKETKNPYDDMLIKLVKTILGIK